MVDKKDLCAGGRTGLAGLALAGLLMFGQACVAQESTDTYALTIYSTAAPGAVPPELYRPVLADPYAYRQRVTVPGYAVVKQERPIELASGLTSIRFSDVAALIDPTTVSFESLTDPDNTHVLEQNYQFDLVSAAKLMERYLGQVITVRQVQGDKERLVTGTLVGTTGGLILQMEGGKVEVINGYTSVNFPELPGGLIAKPTLVWDVAAQRAGPHRVRVTYQTDGMTWWADYNIIFTEGKDANSGVLDVSAWVSIINQSGASYPGAKLKLIAGDVHRAPKPELARARGAYKMGMAGAELDMSAGFEQKAFFEYHLYTLGRPTTLPDNSTKQIELFPTAREVPCEKVMIYYGLATPSFRFLPDPATDRNFGIQSNKKVDIYLRFKNEEKIGMGMPLPSGRIRVSKLDPADKSLEFIGEDTIDHTPKDEKVLIKLGSAFDVVGERKQVDFKVDTRRDWMTETIEIKVRNHKKEPVKVIVKENLYRWVNWEITNTTHEYEKQDSRTIHFPVEVDSDGEVTVQYTVRYTW